MRGLRPSVFLCLFNPIDGLAGRPIPPTPLVIVVDATRALGFSGDKTGPRTVLVGCPRPRLPSVTLRRIVGLPPATGPIEADVEAVGVGPLSAPKLPFDTSPSPCLRDFSCLAWTTRKWESNSGHLMFSSRLILERIVDGWTGALQKKIQ